MCSIRQTPIGAILAIASSFMIGGAKPAIDKTGTLLYKRGGSGCAAYMIASDDMKKIMATTTHDKHNVCQLRTNLNVRLYEMIDAPKWENFKKENFVQDLQYAHDQAAVSYKAFLDGGMSENEAKRSFNFMLKTNLESIAKQYSIKLEWPSNFDAVFKEETPVVHQKNEGRPSSRKAHKKFGFLSKTFG